MPALPFSTYLTVLPESLRRFTVGLHDHRAATALSHELIDTEDTSVSDRGHADASEGALHHVLEPFTDTHEHAAIGPLQYGPPPKTVWYCGNCGDGPHNTSVQPGCSSCGHIRDGCCTVSNAK